RHRVERDAALSCAPRRREPERATEPTGRTTLRRRAARCRSGRPNRTGPRMAEAPETGAPAQAAGLRGRTDVDALVPLVYDELRILARAQLGRFRPGQTLDTTALVHEAYLKLVDRTRAEFKDRKHFFTVASLAMRQIVVDYARRNAAKKRGGGNVHTLLDELDGSAVAVEAQA